MDIFSRFPTITYNGQTAKNILSKTGLVKDIISKYKIFYPYAIKDGERPDTIAHDYYGNADYEWLVCYPNNIIDIHSDWPKSYKEFYRHMKSIYGDINATKNIIHHYKYTGIGGNTEEDIARKSWKMSEETYSRLSLEEKSGWTPVYVYDYELELNNNKRNIVLLSNEYILQINKEIRELYA